MKKIEITTYTDGASRGNPGPGGWGSIVIYNENVVELGGREAQTTNNRMELTAVIQAIKFSGLATQKILAQTKSEHDTQYEITINTDSSYVLNSGTKWVYGWKKIIGKQKQKTMS